MIITPKEIYLKYSLGSDVKIETKCDSCGKIGSTTYNNYIRSQSKRNNIGETFCKKCSSSINGKKRIGTVSPFKGKIFENRRGEHSAAWRGGKYIGSDGYYLIRVESGVVRDSGWAQYRKEHVVLMEQKLGRKLTKKEVVHHIDGNKLNNDIKNLYVCDQNKHRKLHASLQHIAYELFRNKLITFDEKGEYALNDRIKNIIGLN